MSAKTALNPWSKRNTINVQKISDSFGSSWNEELQTRISLFLCVMQFPQPGWVLNGALERTGRSQAANSCRTFTIQPDERFPPAEPALGKKERGPVLGAKGLDANTIARPWLWQWLHRYPAPLEQRPLLSLHDTRIQPASQTDRENRHKGKCKKKGGNRKKAWTGEGWWSTSRWMERVRSANCAHLLSRLALSRCLFSLFRELHSSRDYFLPSFILIHRKVGRR